MLRRNDNNLQIIDVAQKIKREIRGCNLEFLTQKLIEQDELVKDRKIQDGVDKRTYQVNFDKIHKLLPDFKAKWSVERGIERLILDLRHWELDELKFKQRDFYRLQQLEYITKKKGFSNLYKTSNS